MQIRIVVVGFTIVLFMGSFTMCTEFDAATEKAEVEKAIHESIEWPFPEKDRDRLYARVAKDSAFFIFHPDSKSTIIGFEAFKKLGDEVFMSDACRPMGTDIRDIRVNLSRSGDVAWFSCRLDDWGEFGGKPWRWENARWTGVLEKREGKWLMVQEHFSFDSDAEEEPEAVDSTGDEKP